MSVGWATADGTALAGSDYNAASGSVTFAAGAQTATISVQVRGDTTVEPNETFQILLSNPVGMTIGDGSASVTIVDDDTPSPAVSVAATDAAGSEAAQNPIVFAVTRSSSTGTLAVGVAWSGAATLGADYTVTVSGGTLSGGTLTFAAGSATATLTITPVDDTAVEGAEPVTLTLLAGAGYTVGSPASATGQIDDNDAALPQLAIDDLTTTEGDRNTTTINVTIRLSAASTATVTVTATTVAGTALATGDFQSATATVSFAPGQTVRTFSVKIVGDRKAEPTETFTVVLSAAANAAIADGTAVVTILDNDGALTAVAAAPVAADVALTPAELEAAVADAEAGWLRARPDARFSTISVRLGDLDGLLLGLTEGTSITIDATAAGWGWSVSYPGEDALHMDLATVLAHELGHALGLDHEDAGVMAETLAPGMRRLPAAAERAAAAAPALRLLATPSSAWIRGAGAVRRIQAGPLGSVQGIRLRRQGRAHA
jgi:hypothetical protein